MLKKLLTLFLCFPSVSAVYSTHCMEQKHNPYQSIYSRPFAHEAMVLQGSALDQVSYSSATRCVIPQKKPWITYMVCQIGCNYCSHTEQELDQHYIKQHNLCSLV